MHPFKFSTWLTSNLPLAAPEVRALIDRCTTRVIPAGSFLLRQGEICRHSFFVEQGLLSKYGIDDKGKEHILQFAPENWLISDRESVYFQRPALFFIRALEDSRVLVLEESFLTRLAKELPGFSAFNTRLLHNHIHQQNKRIYALLSASAEERYLSFVRTYPDIMLRVPQWMVASYLGITPESLSRVRKQLADRHFKG